MIHSPCASTPQQVSTCAQPNVRKKSFIAGWKLLHLLKPWQESKTTQWMMEMCHLPAPPWAAAAMGIQALVALAPCNTLDQIICGGKWCLAPVELRQGQFCHVCVGQQEKADVLIWFEWDCASLVIPVVMYNLGPSQETKSRAGISGCYCAAVIKLALCTCLYNPVPWGKQPSWPSLEICFAEDG